MKTLEISTTVNLRGGKQNKPGLTLGRSAGPLRTNEEGFVHLSKDPLWAAENGDFCLCLHPHENAGGQQITSSLLLNWLPTPSNNSNLTEGFFSSKDSKAFIISCWVPPHMRRVSGAIAQSRRAGVRGKVGGGSHHSAVLCMLWSRSSGRVNRTPVDLPHPGLRALDISSLQACWRATELPAWLSIAGPRVRMRGLRGTWGKIGWPTAEAKREGSRKGLQKRAHPVPTEGQPHPVALSSQIHPVPPRHTGNPLQPSCLIPFSSSLPGGSFPRAFGAPSCVAWSSTVGIRRDGQPQDHDRRCRGVP